MHKAQIDLNGEFGASNFGVLNATKIKEIETRYNALIAKEATSEAIAIPLLASEVDYNDLWLVSGVIMFCLLCALYASREQEFRNAKYIFNYKPQYADLVIMNQVLSWQSDVKPITKFIQALFWLLPTYLYLYLFYSDLETYSLSVIIVGRSRSIIEYFIEGMMVIAVICANILCLRSQYKLRNLFQKLKPLSGD